MKTHKVASLAATVITDKGGRSGGTVVLCPTHFTTQEVNIEGWMPSEAAGRVAACLVRLKKVSLLVCVIYLYVSEGLSLRNLAILNALAIFLCVCFRPRHAHGGLQPHA